MQETPYHREIVEYFQYVLDWLNGRLPNTDEKFSRITNFIPNNCTYINHLLIHPQLSKGFVVDCGNG